MRYRAESDLSAEPRRGCRGLTAANHPGRVIMSQVLSAGIAVLLFAGAAAAETTQVTTYHNTPDRAGLYTVPGLSATAAASAHLLTGFAGAVQGHVYAQPLYWHPAGYDHGRIIVATESNQIYALQAKTGSVVWHVSLGPAVPNSSLPCGNVDPSGVTGTPVIDPATHTLYVAAMVNKPDGPEHLVYALALGDGGTRPGWPINVRKAAAALGIEFEPAVENQRSALSFVGGRLYVTYGGHYGDCGEYHGWVVGFNPGKPKLFGAWATRSPAGGIWAPGGPAFDGSSIFVATGNTRGSSNWGDGEALLRIPADLEHSTDTHDYYAPANWQTLDNDDLDIGGSGPLPLNVAGASGSTSLLLGLGKDGNAYLLDRDNLGGIGGALLVQQVSPGEIRTAPAAYPTGSGTLVAFQGKGSGCGQSSGQGLTVLGITGGSSPAIATAWCAALDGAGAPIVTTSDGASDPIFWVTGAEGDNMLHGFDALTGQVVFDGGTTADQMTGLRHFGTILAAEGRLYVAADGRVYAFGFSGL